MTSIRLKDYFYVEDFYNLTPKNFSFVANDYARISSVKEKNSQAFLFPSFNFQPYYSVLNSFSKRNFIKDNILSRLDKVYNNYGPVSCFSIYFHNKTDNSNLNFDLFPSAGLVDLFVALEIHLVTKLLETLEYGIALVIHADEHREDTYFMPHAHYVFLDKQNVIVDETNNKLKFQSFGDKYCELFYDLMN